MRRQRGNDMTHYLDDARLIASTAYLLFDRCCAILMMAGDHPERIISTHWVDNRATAQIAGVCRQASIILGIQVDPYYLAERALRAFRERVRVLIDAGHAENFSTCRRDFAVAVAGEIVDDLVTTATTTKEENA